MPQNGMHVNVSDMDRAEMHESDCVGSVLWSWTGLRIIRQLFHFPGIDLYVYVMPVIINSGVGNV